MWNKIPRDLSLRLVGTQIREYVGFVSMKYSMVVRFPTNKSVQNLIQKSYYAREKLIRFIR